MSKKTRKRSSPMLKVMREIGGCVRQAFCARVGTTDIEGFQFVFDSNVAAFFATARVDGKVQEEVLEFDSIGSPLVVPVEDTYTSSPTEEEAYGDFLGFLGEMLKDL